MATISILLLDLCSFCDFYVAQQLYFCDGECHQENDNWAALAVLLLVDDAKYNNRPASRASIAELEHLLVDPTIENDPNSKDKILPEYATHLSDIVSSASGFFHYHGYFLFCHHNTVFIHIVDIGSSLYYSYSFFF